nr:putative zinc finger protein [uncultured bacterium]
MSAQKFGTTWWGRRWVRLLESLSTSYPNPRLVRGRTLARTAVTDLTVTPGAVSASVRQGRTAHSTCITVPTLTDDEWTTTTRVLTRQVGHLADLLSARMPTGTDEELTDAGVPLFPARDDLSSTCTCPDTEATPCAHGAATHYAFAKEFDADPFLLFALRGRSREELLAALRAAPTEGVPIHSLNAETFFAAKADLKSLHELLG